MYLWDHAPPPGYVHGAIDIMGIVAHSTTPWQGSVGGMTIEDSLILSTLLGRASTRAEAVVVLRLYDQLRRPRTQRIVESSRESGAILTGRGAETGFDLEKFRENLLPRWNFIVDFENKKHRDEALRLIDAELTKSQG